MIFLILIEWREGGEDGSKNGTSTRHQADWQDDDEERASKKRIRE